jgi:hypothetical protein
MFPISRPVPFPISIDTLLFVYISINLREIFPKPRQSVSPSATSTITGSTITTGAPTQSVTIIT